MRVRDKQIAVSPSLHYEAKVAAAKKGMNLKEITEAALRLYLATNGGGKTLIDSKAPYSSKAAS